MENVKKVKSSKGKNKQRIEHIKASQSVNYSSKPLPKLPLDCITAVLARLSVSTLRKFRGVCKSWNVLIREDRCLASQHFNYSRRLCQERPGLISLSISRPWSEPDSDMPEVYTLNYFSGNDRMVHKFDIRELLPDGSYTITNSCDGLVGVYGIDSFYIVNPGIRKIRGLPKGIPHIGDRSQTPQAGLGFDALTGEYKVVGLFHREADGYGCQVLSLGGAKTRSWRLIDDPPIEAYKLSSSQHSLPVAVNGAIYWTLNSGFEKGVVALTFDLGQEKFDVLMHPEGSSRRRPSITWVTELGGCLCVADTITYGNGILWGDGSKFMNIWLLRNYGNFKSRWVKYFKIDLRKVHKPIHRFYTLVLKPLMIDGGKIVLCCGQGRRDYYDPETRRFGKHLQIRDIYAEYVSPYDESLLWPWPRFCTN